MEWDLTSKQHIPSLSFLMEFIIPLRQLKRGWEMTLLGFYNSLDRWQLAFGWRKIYGLDINRILPVGSSREGLNSGLGSIDKKVITDPSFIVSDFDIFLEVSSLR